MKLEELIYKIKNKEEDYGIEPKYTINEIKNRYNEGEKLSFSFFYGGYYSQWFPSNFVVNDIKYCNSEQYMMAKKADFFDDNIAYNKIMNETEPYIIKKLGRNVKNFNEDEWDKVKYTIVLTGNYHKFTQNEKFRKYLLNDYNIIVEASPTDKIWGIGLNEKDLNIENPNTWNGLNLLGFAIMHVRDIIIKN